MRHWQGAAISSKELIMKFIGTVIDPSWHKAMLLLPLEQRANERNKQKPRIDLKVEEGFDFIFSLTKLPRFYKS
jgi:hypothetical protein